jgi:hypothetical protein
MQAFFSLLNINGVDFVNHSAMEIFKAIIMNDYKDAPYATWIKWGEKTIETRMRSFSYRGDIIICCGKTNSVGSNAGLALCLVELWKIRPMRWTDEEAAGVPYSPARKSFLLRNWRHFSRDFEFAPQKIAGAWQSIFDITLPEDVRIIPMPGIKPFDEEEEQK